MCSAQIFVQCTLSILIFEGVFHDFLIGPKLALCWVIENGKKTVLLVDDYRSLREGILLLLEDDYRIVAVETGEQAMEVVSALGPDLIVLDLKLPGISGVEVLSEMRSRKIDSPVLIISAIQDPSVAAHLYRMGACDYLTKPFGIHELRGKMEQILRGRSQAQCG